MPPRFPVGWRVVRGAPRLTALVLTCHDQPGDRPFSEFRVGLDHVSLAVPDLATLEAWQAWLREYDVPSDLRRSEWGHHLNVRDPDNIAVELILREPRRRRPAGRS